ncbi:MAG: LysM peptidoglycan-binding domain-containing M23 family metallopeptidase [Candidatus Omnitrophica bacterium]|nr:LysM peptidoglycan-binding domain-containing M23 family metallopeptidase [Candidatus Omnitrophota bacterium]
MKYKVLILLLFFMNGCASSRYPIIETGTTGTYHIVNKKETLWSISNKYNIDINELIEINRIPNGNKIEKGQRIFIPKKDDTIQSVSEKQKKTLEIIETKGERFIWPVKGSILSSFGQKKGESLNNGIDIKVPVGSSVKASKSGTVTFCSDVFKGYGKTIIIDHGDGYQTVYAYNSANLTSEGDFVRQDQVIAKSGSSGRAQQPSLHFEIRKKHNPVNPINFLG